MKKLSHTRSPIILGIASLLAILGLLATLGLLDYSSAQSDSEAFFKDLLDLQTVAGVLKYTKMEIRSPSIKNGDILHVTIPPQTIISGDQLAIEMTSLAIMQRISKSLKAKIILTSTHGELKPIEGEILYEITLLE